MLGSSVGTTREVKLVEPKWMRTWNVKALLQNGELENLKTEMNRVRLDVLATSELR